MGRSRFLLDAFLLGALAAPFAAHAQRPDLVVSFLTVTPRAVAPGGAIEMVSEMRNIGTAPVPVRGPSAASAFIEIRLMTAETDPSGPLLGGWGPFTVIPPGTSERHTNHGTVPATTAPGRYFACATVDRGHVVAESDETNNRTCVSLTVTGGPEVRITPPAIPGVRPKPSLPFPGVQPDLMITGVAVGGVSGLSRSATLTVRNAGTGPATNFRMDAYQLVPKRWQLLFTVCAQTTRGGSASCPSVWEAGTLAAGATKTYTGWVTFPADHKPGSSERVEFMADGCFPALEPALPAACRVAESNETNNTRLETLGVP